MAPITAPLLALVLAAASPAPDGPHAPPSHPLAPGGMGTSGSASTQRSETPRRMAATVAGIVRDARDNQPVSGALVQQTGSVTSVFTDAEGRFRLLLDKAAGNTLTVAAMGFEDQTFKFTAGQEATVSLREVSGFLATAPLAPLVPVGFSAAETAPLNSGIDFAYSLRNSMISAPGLSGGNATITGVSNNDYKIGARIRLRPWLIEAEASHFQMPVDLAGLSREDNPVFRPSTYQAGARLGALWAINRDIELGVLGAYRWTNTVPNNGDVPFTGSDIDVEQTRHALGGEAVLAVRPGRGAWHFEVGGGFYPLIYASAKAPGSPFAASNLIDAHAMLGYEVMPGLRLGLGAQLDRYSGVGQDQAVRGTVGIHYTPGGVPKGNE